MNRESPTAGNADADSRTEAKTIEFINRSEHSKRNQSNR